MNHLLLGTADMTDALIERARPGFLLIDDGPVADAFSEQFRARAFDPAQHRFIALSVQSANDLVAAIAISDASNVWDAGIRGTKAGAFALDGNALTQIAMGAAQAGAMIKTTAIREITATVATAALTAGKMNVFVEFLISD
ncbi:hypothetical protein [Nitrobacter sp. TKz-YC01]|uniref:hypothetical protein n=1 Tax=Nitrobacter sp. TKz-YC01 TaxID=3398703 RepID=UPI003A101CF4